ncbi:tetratricopeptide repeat protein [Nocardiopsis lambiniae]|uniref:Tetratricopeptide repeat protein n=1 Tax=Nocardiopsis lambiniae TaxID=3075539 RepID=A0ABU2MB79_9ACTN|nr:tetratricopeptide repeat protein [Nocardiopsis sp. DSM 44743]MDT0329926.1 tetratricopeptide repeat protein [Nocardiopsis sp. DSM 44743]
MSEGPVEGELVIEYGVLFGEPFDEWSAKAGTLLELHRYRESHDILERLLVMADGLEATPLVDLLRGTLLSDLGRAHIGLADLRRGADALDRALGLLRPPGPHVTDPVARPIRAGLLVHALIDRAENARRLGDTELAATLLDEAGARVEESTTADAHRAEIAGGRAMVLATRGAWGAAENVYRAALAGTDPTLRPVPYLLSGLADVAADTGRLDEAEDLLAQAAERFRALGGEPASLDGSRAFVALRRGDLDEAERLYLKASVAFERDGDPVSLAACEQARALLARLRGSTDAARASAAASRRRFEELGVRAALGEGLLEDARRALAVGDHPTMRERCERARALFEEQGSHERCAQVDLLVASTTMRLVEAGAFPGREHQTRAAVVTTVVPVALTLAAMRADFATGHARAQWSALSRAATDLAFRLAWTTGDQGLLFELVEFSSTGAPLAAGRDTAPADPVAELFPAPAARGPGLRVGLPPRVAVSPERTALQEYAALAEARYHRPVLSDERVAPVRGTDVSFPGPVPTVLVRLADADGLYMAWRWTAGAQGFGTGYAPATDVDAALAELSAALPGPEGALIRALTEGALADPVTERALAGRLAETLWPVELTDQIRTVAEGTGARPLVRIQPSPRTGRVPWELLAVADGTRLLDLADVALAAPAALVPAAPRPRSGTGAPAVLILDPRVPGFRADSPLGSVLGRPGGDPGILALIDAHRTADDMLPRVAAPEEALRRTDLDRHWLGEALRSGPRRLLYVGHVTSAPVAGGQSEDALLHLCCAADVQGHAEPMRGHRPLGAKDLLLGTPDGRPGHEVWPAPPRVALIACESGADTRFAEPFGPASAMLRNGADLVTAARWTLPTDLALRRFGRVPDAERPFSGLIAAVDAAHDAPAPVRALADWQRTRLERWRTIGDPAATPLLWAALATVTAGPR